MLRYLSKFSKLDPHTHFHSHHYLQHTARRLEHLASLSIPIEHKAVLELGAGIGDHTGFFIERRCEVLATDSRAENLHLLQARFPACKTMLLDVDADSSPLGARFQVVHAYGLLYHLADPVRALERISAWTEGILLLETCVSPHSDGPNVVTENRNNPTQAQGGFGCRPGRQWLFEQLKLHFDFVYSTVTQPRHPEFPLDWNGANDSALTRAVFICSRFELALPMLSRDLAPLQQPQI